MNEPVLAENALTEANFRKGFLIDEEFMAGVSENPDKPGQFMAFLVEHESGEVVSSELFGDLNLALNSINTLPREWAFESVSGCGNGNCKNGQCGSGNCGTGGGCASGSCDN